MEHNCYNHPERRAYSICHNCGKSFCEDCLVEGGEYYYCKNTACQKVLREKNPEPQTFSNNEIVTQLSEYIICPNCESELQLSKEERQLKKIHCPECETFIDFNVNPPKIFKTENYILLLTSLNQADIGVIKSILDDNEIDYYVNGENFLAVRPLVQPVQFFVNENQFEEAKELFKDFDLKIYGFSTSNDE